jgi:hypothetical protein
MDDRLPGDAVDRIVESPANKLEEVRRSLEQQFSAAASQKSEDLTGAVTEAIEIRRLLDQNTEEIRSIIRALNGEYVLPEAGGDLLRDGPGVLPTGWFFPSWKYCITTMGSTGIFQIIYYKPTASCIATRMQHKSNWPTSLLTRVGRAYGP